MDSLLAFLIGSCGILAFGSLWLATRRELKSLNLRLRKAYLQLDSSLRLLRLIESLSSWTFRMRIDPYGEILLIYSEGELARYFGGTTEQVKGRSLASVFPEYLLHSATSAIRLAFTGQAAEFTFSLNNRYYHVALRPFFFAADSAEVTEIAGYATDITERKLAEDRVRHLAYHDHLTSLSNRAAFYERLRDLLNRGISCVLLLLDLDNFKKVNDTYGHDAGDYLLQQVAKRLLSCLRRDRDFAARLGGDEFVVVLPDISDQATAQDIAARLLKTLAAPLDYQGQDLLEACRVTASIGIAFSEPHDTPDSLYKKADSVMYLAKKRGKNQYAIAD